MPTEIKRGDIFWVDFSPARGSEQKGQRPALVIQNDIGNKVSSTIIIAACSTSYTGQPYPFQVVIKAKESGLSKDTVVDLGQILTIDKSRLINKSGSISKNKMAEVDKAIAVSLGLTEF